MRGLGGRIAHVFSLEKAANDMRLALAATQVSAHGMDQFGAGAWTMVADICFDVVVEQLVGIELGAVAWQEVEPNPAVGMGEPSLDRPRLVHRMAVDDEEHGAAGLALETTEELQEHPRGEPALEQPVPLCWSERRADCSPSAGRCPG